MDYNELINYKDDYDILDDDEIFLLDDNKLIERIEAQSKRRIIKPKREDWN